MTLFTEYDTFIYNDRLYRVLHINKNPEITWYTIVELFNESGKYTPEIVEESDIVDYQNSISTKYLNQGN